ncbi:4-aminobutyrate--2-oxoglutarate transaminase [Microbacterium esteraromaticum]|uniref:4-aminobutyrate--2-oxoglutarate transaminase n=1 Tax=Microbacterium esteraromaticum TaxID=57043 RepID=UPI0019D34527|nr:4-aminobutyrate--2-oxoglutarate transaminase [Microbacterium esteraromaticum]MBN7793289.1 4-aminobutyrate--2-oxoglutarate transaminase [Microbacterium esteraromaticum]MCA1305595.1 4-aminobutyrate--2-oxoglutarate transaminase [Microbacterium esteraromaticum]
MTSVPHLLTDIPGPRSRELHAQREAAVASGYAVTLPVFVARADTSTVEDVDGNTLIDFASGIAVTSIGASNPRLRANVAAQLERFTHTCFMVTEYEGFVRVAEWLNEHAPGECDKRTALFSTGAEAVENAVKIARHYTGRAGVLVIDEAYHGRSMLTMAMTAKEDPYKSGFGPFPADVVRGPNANPLRGRPVDETLAQIQAIVAERGADYFAAIVVEPIQGEGGFVVPATGFLPGLRRLADEHGILLVVDEIQTGLGRTGQLFASEHEGIAGDLTLTAKALGGGLPLSAVTGRAEVVDAVHVGGLGGTYAGNPLACAAALAVFEVLEEPGLLAGVGDIEATIRAHLEPLRTEIDALADVRGRGAMMAVEFADAGSLAPRPDLAQRISAACHAEGVLTLTCGTHGNVIRLLPPLVIEKPVLEAGLEILVRCIRTIAAEEAAA